MSSFVCEDSHQKQEVTRTHPARDGRTVHLHGRCRTLTTFTTEVVTFSEQGNSFVAETVSITAACYLIRYSGLRYGLHDQEMKVAFPILRKHSVPTPNKTQSALQVGAG
jgi:hypothetical protein